MVDIILLNYNGWRDTTDCLESVFRSDYPEFRVIVCDNGSTDESRALLEAWARGELRAGERVTSSLQRLVVPPVPKPIEYVVYDRASAAIHATADAGRRLVFIHNGGNIGFSAGNNVGVRYALARGGADYTLFLNNDMLIAPTAVSELVRCAESDPRIGATGATILDFREPELVQEAAGGTFAPWSGMVAMSQRGAARGTTRSGVPLDYVSGGCLFVRTSVLHEVGLLDERYFIYGEDQDYGIRVRRAGYRLAYCRVAEVWHRGGGATVHRSAHFDYNSLKSNLQLISKHYPLLLPVAAAYSVVRCVLPKLARRQWHRLPATARAYRDFTADLLRGRTGAREA